MALVIEEGILSNPIDRGILFRYEEQVRSENMIHIEQLTLKYPSLCQMVEDIGKVTQTNLENMYASFAKMKMMVQMLRQFGTDVRGVFTAYEDFLTTVIPVVEGFSRAVIKHTHAYAGEFSLGPAEALDYQEGVDEVTRRIFPKREQLDEYESGLRDLTQKAFAVTEAIVCAGGNRPRGFPTQRAIEALESVLKEQSLERQDRIYALH